MICAGDEALFNEIKDNDLTLVGKASFFLGDIGKGSRMKLAVNMVMGKFVSRRALGLYKSSFWYPHGVAGPDPPPLFFPLSRSFSPSPSPAYCQPTCACSRGMLWSPTNEPGWTAAFFFGLWGCGVLPMIVYCFVLYVTNSPSTSLFSTREH